MTTIPHKKFSGKLLTKCRKAKKMSRLDLARAIDFKIGPETIENYEKGRVSPKVDVVLLIAATLGVKPGDLTE